MSGWDSEEPGFRLGRALERRAHDFYPTRGSEPLDHFLDAPPRRQVVLGNHHTWLDAKACNVRMRAGEKGVEAGHSDFLLARLPDTFDDWKTNVVAVQGPQPHVLEYPRQMSLTVKDVRSLARCHTEMAVKVLSSVAQNSTSDSAKVAAATELLNRGWGRAPAAAGDGEQVTIVIRRILEGKVAEVAPATNGRLPEIDGELLPPEE